MSGDSDKAAADVPQSGALQGSVIAVLLLLIILALLTPNKTGITEPLYAREVVGKRRPVAVTAWLDSNQIDRGGHVKVAIRFENQSDRSVHRISPPQLGTGILHASNIWWRTRQWALKT